jgi:hypothetical protein
MYKSALNVTHTQSVLILAVIVSDCGNLSKVSDPFI